MCVGAKPLYASIPERISCHRKDFRRIVTRCDRQAPWVNTLSEGLQVDDLKTTHNVITALRLKLEGDGGVEERA